MDKLFSPWRSKYIETFSKPNNEGVACVFCEAIRGDDEEHLIIFRGKSSFVLMNLFPYNSGHIMIVPYRHIQELNDLSTEESLEVIQLLQKMITALRTASHPEGFNIGANLGRSAGAGIDRHLHFHLVPRWNGDTNFMPVLADTKMISEDMKDTWKKLRNAMKLL
ncbi:MAG: HIT family protein [Bacteroidota bacterium]